MYTTDDSVPEKPLKEIIKSWRVFATNSLDERLAEVSSSPPGPRRKELASAPEKARPDNFNRYIVVQFSLDEEVAEAYQRDSKQWKAFQQALQGIYEGAKLTCGERLVAVNASNMTLDVYPRHTEHKAVVNLYIDTGYEEDKRLSAGSGGDGLVARRMETLKQVEEFTKEKLSAAKQRDFPLGPMNVEILAGRAALGQEPQVGS